MCTLFSFIFIALQNVGVISAIPVYWASSCLSVRAHTSACTYIVSIQQLFSFIWMFKGQDSRPLKMEVIGCPKMLVRNHCYLLSNNPEEQSSHLLCGRSLKSHVYTYVPVSFSSLWELLLFNLNIILEFYHQLSLYDELLSSILSFYCQCEHTIWITFMVSL